MSTSLAAVEGFWRRLERMRVDDMLALAARPVDEHGHREVVRRAHAAAADAGLTGIVQDTHARIDEWVLAMFNRSTVQPGWMEANWGRPGTVEDRANLAASLREVATALILGPRLVDGDRDELLGAWAELAAG